MWEWWGQSEREHYDKACHRCWYRWYWELSSVLLQSDQPDIWLIDGAKQEPRIQELDKDEESLFHLFNFARYLIYRTTWRKAPASTSKQQNNRADTSIQTLTTPGDACVHTEWLQDDIHRWQQSTAAMHTNWQRASDSAAAAAAAVTQDHADSHDHILDSQMDKLLIQLIHYSCSILCCSLWTMFRYVNNKFYRAHRHEVSNALQCRLQYCANRNVFNWCLKLSICHVYIAKLLFIFRFI